MVLVIILAIVAIAGAIGAGVAVARDSGGSVPTIRGYDSRNPLP